MRVHPDDDLAHPVLLLAPVVVFEPGGRRCFEPSKPLLSLFLPTAAPGLRRPDESRTHRHLIVPFIEAPNETNNFYPDVSPDGRHIAFTRFGFHGITSQVWVAGISGAHARPLTAPRLEAFGPNWSPDGRSLAFSSNANRWPGAIYVMRADGTGGTRLAAEKWPNSDIDPAYSPGGGQVAFSSDRRHPDLCCLELFVMRANGSQQHLVDTDIQGVIEADWGNAPPVPAGSPGTPPRRAGLRSAAPAMRAATKHQLG